MKYLKYLCLLLVLFLTGCKVELYRNLPQDEANQMVALLMLNHIDVNSEIDGKTGKVTLQIEKDKFIDAVEILRQNGYPKTQYVGIEDLFPAGQLVSSPAQEEAKMRYLKEQQLERTLSSMDGVISARVSIAQADNSESNIDNTTAEKSVAVYIKYSPEVNMNGVEAQIRNLIKNAISGLQSDKISLFLQPAEFRYQPQKMQTNQQWQYLQNYIVANKTLILLTFTGIFIVVFAAVIFGRRKDKS
ncbi:type III secretion inner membrane ring lipoprotein SctJ [Arsenophonus nasoniae]|uniref:Lipoprotein n=1 Tax=Arsenophonus nasoniae TaxID=638 RepID=A0A4P7KTV3_9GAMM|nr:type III secretion inner membrane ring lipoprotein SctJ [Arsenophonus nasoniae]QBY41900.1 Yop proteins translocation lipoprotein J [Arsenophonus nasoniae]WGL95004.1 type III secretion inner membrane ring lipoprotein SctJ [Arsenophonus nasoniae]WGM01876.1 type III secretion inner membrane ring lipoprotein SctJ [Arsenophonus nasoniae]WGM06113.1 type III secretion inner membrane ring lipoprotein SctJ [Arsenophonus nasoniae]WGM11075.1 type III secretion inner membrane ring lipoprotein SctJ [Ars